MKRVYCSSLALLVSMSCSSGSSNPPASGTGGAASGSGGSPGSGGIAVSSGGSTGSTGGITGSGGTQSTGGSGQGGGTATGGSTGTGGVAGGGSGGSTGGGTGGAGGDLTSIVGAWDGALLKFPCQAAGANYDCTNVGCARGTATTTTKVFPIAGLQGTVYNVTFRVRGIVEVYAYIGGTRAAGASPLSTSRSLFCQGGTQQTAGNGNDYNTYQLTVSPAVTSEPSNTYYLNSVIPSENPHTATNVTQHRTFPIDYSATIKVMGGGTVTFTTFDSNCALVQNCGPDPVANQCQAPRTVSLAGASPPPSGADANFDAAQPYQAPTGAHGQWVFFDITSVAVAP